MFFVDLYREPQGFQDTIEVEVISHKDEIFLKRNHIKVDLEDRIFKTVFKATLPSGKVLELDKINTETMTRAFARLVSMCKSEMLAN